MRRLAPGKIVLLAIVLIVPGIGVYFGMGDALRASEKPAEYIGVIYSILAASLFAVVSIVGDPSMLMPGNWRQAWQDAKDVQLRLMRLTYLFVLYLIVLALLVASEIIEHAKLESWYIVHDVFAYLATAAFLVSLWLPFEIKEIQILRLEQEIKARRERPR
ncbi:hypothetical protein [Salipiger bermudensis]|uniref:hypothetical protein n=1 Tax=Salipiger bermudensis TaxID=344736 RepID=UPI001CD36F0D|nr:hypothetical protein [Salipiger bermudensis]MCA0961972.1 hypothetical protein [Salipiger bermudensis]